MKIFISHSGNDKWVARQISKLLSDDGHTTFLDEKDIQTGESIDATIQSHLKDSDHLLLLLSPSSIKSQWVFIELGGAKALEKRVVPILFHVAANEVPAVISQLLARDINDIDKYFSELKGQNKTAKPKPASKAKRKAKKKAAATVLQAAVAKATKSARRTFGSLSVGDTVKIVEVEHLTDEDKSQSPKWVKEMDKFSGVTSKITAFSPFGNAYLEVSGDNYRWHPSWIAKVA